MSGDMRVIVFGATGKTGMHAWRKALQQGHQVTAFGRSVDRLSEAEPELHTFKGDVLDLSEVTESVAGHDAVIVCIGSTNLKDTTTLSSGTKNIVDAMRQHEIERLVVISAAGVGESWKQISLMARVLFRTLLRNVFADHQAQEAIIRQSALDWTIVRAAVLNDRPATGYAASNSSPAKRISREDLADFLVDQVSDSTYSRQAISVASS